MPPEGLDYSQYGEECECYYDDITGLYYEYDYDNDEWVGHDEFNSEESYYPEYDPNKATGEINPGIQMASDFNPMDSLKEGKGEESSIK